jgi:hypothetical protein
MYMKALIGTNVRPAQVGDFPFVVSIVGINPNIPIELNIWCTATRITRRLVLTSEHCLRNSENRPFQIIEGSVDVRHGTSFFPLWSISYDQWAYHNNIQVFFIDNDILLIQVKYTK